MRCHMSNQKVERPKKFKHEFAFKHRMPNLSFMPSKHANIHTFVFRWNDCDNEGMREYVERLVLEGFISVNHEFFTYVVTVCKSWKL
jgi:hypothetical protein